MSRYCGWLQWDQILELLQICFAFKLVPLPLLVYTSAVHLPHLQRLAQFMQHLQPGCLVTGLSNPKAQSSVRRKQSCVKQYSLMLLSRHTLGAMSLALKCTTDSESCCWRPALPICWRKSIMVLGGFACMICVMEGESNPIPIAALQNTSLMTGDSFCSSVSTWLMMLWSCVEKKMA